MESDNHTENKFEFSPREGMKVENYTFIKNMGQDSEAPLWLIQDDSKTYFTCRIIKNEITERLKVPLETYRQLNHKNIIKLESILSHDNYTLLILEYVKSQTLTEYLSRSTKVDILTGLELSFQIAAGMEYLHDKWIIHGNLHPDNILVTEYGGIKISDVISRPVSMKKSRLIKVEGGGKIEFYSSEQLRDEDSVAADDIYSFGAILYFLVSGKRPFYKLSPVKVLKSKPSTLPREPYLVNREVTPELSSFIMRMLSKKRIERFQKFENLIPDLEKHQKQYKIKSRKIDLHGHKRFPVYPIIAILLIVIAVFLLFGQGEDELLDVSSSFAFQTKRIDPWGIELNYPITNNEVVYSNDGFRLLFRDVPPGHLIVLNISPDETVKLLYPQSPYELTERTDKAKPNLTIPAADKFYKFDTIIGQETLYIIITLHEWKELNRLISRYVENDGYLVKIKNSIQTILDEEMKNTEYTKNKADTGDEILNWNIIRSETGRTVFKVTLNHK